jgi:hypothetical protein
MQHPPRPLPRPPVQVRLLRHAATKLIRAIAPTAHRLHRLHPPDPPRPLLVTHPRYVRRPRAASTMRAAALLAAALLVPRVGAQEPWTTKMFMPRGNEDCQNSCVGFGDMFYNIHGRPSINAGELSKYNTLADAWTTGECLARAWPRPFGPAGDGSRAAKSLPYFGLFFMATNAYGNGIYLLDAYPQTTFITTQKYNPQTDVWTSVKKIPTYRAISSAEQAAVAVTVGSRIYVLGGGAPPSAVRARHEVYSPLSDSWTTKKALPLASIGAGAGGGSCGSAVVYGGGYTNTNSFALYNTATDLWAAGERPTGRHALAGAAWRALSGRAVCRPQLAYQCHVRRERFQRELFLPRWWLYWQHHPQIGAYIRL